MTVTKPVQPTPTNLRSEGVQEFLTTSRCEYVWRPPTERITIHRKGMPTSQLSSAKLDRRRQPFIGETQFKADFPPEPAWNGVRPSTACAPRQVLPPPSELCLSEDDVRYLDTEHREQFSQRDPPKDPRPKSSRREIPPYSPPTVKFASTTVTKSDFRPYPLSVIRAFNNHMDPKDEDRGAINIGDCTLSTEEATMLKEYLRMLNSS
ncbi:unnamed protein product [Dicrocoelium dendriticum]|nr:unnamed protein product [Dicrocoelium dendriticum]